MRRALLTPRQGGGPFTVGEPDTVVVDFGFVGGYLYWSAANPAPRAGTLTSIKIGVYTAGSVQICVGTGNASSFTVTAMTPGVSGVNAGQDTLSVNLAIPAGGLIGCWLGPGTQIGLGSTGAFSYQSAASPTVGAVYAGSVYSGEHLALNGTGA